MRLVPAAIQTITLAGLFLYSAIACSQSDTSITGSVINAKTGAPVSRALVKVGDKSALTDSDGRFQFHDVTGGGTISMRKPGFYPGIAPSDQGQISLASLPSNDGLTLCLYPEALITGTLRSQDGLPLRAIPVEAIRKNASPDSPWSTVATTRTDAHGDFRMTLPAGEYRFKTFYIPFEQTTQKSVLPASYPDSGPSDTSNTLHLRYGEEQHVDLQAVVAASQNVSIDAVPEHGSRGISITARTADDAEFNLGISSRGQGGTLKTRLPEGSYFLHAFRGQGEILEEAATTVDVPDHDLNGVVLRFSPVTSLPIEVEESNTDTASATPPTTQQLGLVLQSTTGTDQRSVLPLPDGNKGMRFMAPSGTYRLHEEGSSAWFIQSALYGDTDLLTEDLVVTPGESATPIRLIVGNQTGTLQGTISLRGSPAAHCVVYLASDRAGHRFSAYSNAEGGFSFAELPPGDYRALAFERTFDADFSDPAFLDRFGQHLQHVTITPDDSATVHLDAATIEEMLQ